MNMELVKEMLFFEIFNVCLFVCKKAYSFMYIITFPGYTMHVKYTKRT